MADDDELSEAPENPRFVKVIRGPNGWVEITTFWRNNQGWQHRSIRLSAEEFEGIKRQ